MRVLGDLFTKIIENFSKIIREICVLKTLKECPNIVEITDVIK